MKQSKQTMIRIAVVGGGPGGLFSTTLLEEFCSELCEVTVFEASERLGGKVVTGQFSCAPALYEVGVAELYDYSHFGPDPVRQMVNKLGLTTVPMQGPGVILGDVILRHSRDIRRAFGKPVMQAVLDFQRKCRALCTPDTYYEGHQLDDNNHPWANQTFEEVLDTIPNEIARKYISVAVRSDTATEPHLTSALNGLKNVLMDDSEYLQLYSIVGGIEQLMIRLADRVTSDLILKAPVTQIGRMKDGTYQITAMRNGKRVEDHFDMVILSIPNYHLQRLEWDSAELRLAMQKHLVRYDRPAHYLRMALLFKEPFWRELLPDSYFMTDAFNGVCIYDETSRHPCPPYGVLSWLVAGNDALTLSNLSDEELIQKALQSLPKPMAKGRSLYLEGRVHRWVGTINGLPGGNPVVSLEDRHQPDRVGHPGLFVVGDYLFDSTINGVYDSADFVTDLIMTELRKRKYSVENPAATKIHATVLPKGHSANSKHAIGFNGILDKEYHDLYDGKRTYEECFRDYFCEEYTTELIRTIWGWKPPYTLLDCGSASGLTLEAFAKVGVDAWGIENSAYIHARTPEEWKERNILGDVRKLPFADGQFDFVYDTCLCYIPEKDLDVAIRELFRVCRVGVYFGGVASDMTQEVIEEYGIFEDVKSLLTLWQWSEVFMRNGFRMAVSNQKVLARIWEIENNIDDDDHHWYPDKESMRYCFFSKPDAPPPSDPTLSTRRRPKIIRRRG